MKQCADCTTMKKAEYCRRCYERARLEIERLKMERDMFLGDIDGILAGTAYHRLADVMRARLAEENFRAQGPAM